jgi:hypothetical protein
MMKSLMDFIKDLNEINSDLIDAETIADIAEDVGRGATDFLAWGYRFIRADKIDDILKEELLSDLYFLGCFNASFLSGIDGFPIDYDDIKTIQDAGAYEAIGKIAARYIDEIASEYSRLDGYGHHFGSYDGNEYELSVNEEYWHVFRVD